jgi:RND family efflux transporter MFP subunit
MNKLPLVRFGCSASVLLVSIGIAVLLWKFRPETPSQPPREPELTVHLQTARQATLVVELESHGQVRALRQVQLSAQVSGEIIEMNSNLRAGLQVEKNQLLVKIDPRDSENALEEATAAVSRLEANQKIIETNLESDREQLRLARRSQSLAQKDFKRLKGLSDQGQAVSISVVETSERSLTQAEGQVIQFEQSLALAPSRLREVESDLQAARARIKQMELQLARTEIRAPFDGRVVQSQVEIGEYLQPGAPVLSLSDDSVLEIHVPVTAADIRNWLPFEPGDAPDTGWFRALQPVPVSITWSESATDQIREGTLHRITHFDSTTRTGMVAVRIDTSSATGKIPLTEGMFCRVRIPGNELMEVFPLPREAVTFNGQAYLSVEGRLKTVEVEVARSEGDQVYVSKGLSEGDQVIVTRLVAPLEGAKLIEAGE